MFNVSAKQASAFRARRRRRLSHHSSNAWANFEQTLLLQLCDNALRRIGVDLHRLAERADGGERITRTQPPGHDGLTGGKGYLFVSGRSGLQSNLKWDHTCTMYLVTLEVKKK